MSETKRESVLRKVQALLDKASSTTFDAERDLLIAKADEMMATWAIEEFELGQKDPKKSVRPELRGIVVPPSGGFDIRMPLSSMLQSLCRHVGVRVGGYKWERDAEGRNVDVLQVVGYPSDLDYVEMLFLNLQIHFLSKMDPKPDASKSDLENFIALWESGDDYKSIWRKMGWEWLTNGSSGTGLVTAERKRLRGLRSAYAARCAEEGREPMKGLKGETYRKSFIAGYAARISSRLSEMKTARDEAASGHELAIVSMRDDLDEFFFDVYPDRRPHPKDCECESCHFAKCVNEKCDRPKCKEWNRNKNKPVRYAKAQPIDGRAYRFGGSVAESADLSGSSKVAGTKGAIK